jgi:hypothetical protein
LDFKFEWSCGMSAESGLERLTCSIAIRRLRVFTQPGPQADIV